jgi:hypothetical protein
MLPFALAELRRKVLIEMNFVISANDDFVTKLQPVKKVAELVDLFKPTVGCEVACMNKYVSFLVEDVEMTGLSVSVGNTQYLELFLFKLHNYYNKNLRELQSQP